MDTYDIIQAAKGRPFNSYAEADAKETVRIQIDRAFFLSGMAQPDALAYEQLIDEVLGKILRSYGYMTSQELALVVEAGVGGELSRQTRPNAATVFSWIAAYMASDTRREAIRNYRQTNVGAEVTLTDRDVEALVQTARRRILTESELYALRKSGALTPRVVDALNNATEVRALRALWDEYKRAGRIAEDHRPGYVAMVMDAAEKRGLFAIAPEHREFAREQARKDYRRRNRVRSVGDMLDYTPEYMAKWVLLGMCFNGQKASGRDLIIND